MPYNDKLEQVWEIYSIDINKEDNFIACGCKDGTVYVVALST